MENSSHLKMYILLKMVIFQCHVSFQGGTSPKKTDSVVKNSFLLHRFLRSVGWGSFSMSRMMKNRRES